MDRDFSWNARPDVEAMVANAGNPMNKVKSIQNRIDALKAERAQLVEQLGTEYGDDALGAQMMRAGDDGAMYRFLRGQNDQLRMNEAEKAKEGMPTQADVDKTLETLYATEASLKDPTRPTEKEQKLLGVYRRQLDRMKEKNPNLDYGDSSTVTPPGESGTELWQLEREFALNNSLTDDEIDEKVNEGIKSHPGYTEQYQKLGADAKKRSDTAYAEYKADIDRKNGMIKELFNAYYNTTDSATKKVLSGLIKSAGGKIDGKGNAVYLKAKSKKDWVKGK